jgi:hypothetical protein
MVANDRFATNAYIFNFFKYEKVQGLRFEKFPNNLIHSIVIWNQIYSKFNQCVECKHANVFLKMLKILGLVGGFLHCWGTVVKFLNHCHFETKPINLSHFTQWIVNGIFCYFPIRFIQLLILENKFTLHQVYSKKIQFNVQFKASKMKCIHKLQNHKICKEK